jgi:hypothetical protein
MPAAPERDGLGVRFVFGRVNHLVMGPQVV